MFVSQTTEYALRAMVWLASRSGTPLGTRAIARGTRVPPGYLSKVLQLLARNGLVKSRPGRNGGFTLARPAEKVSVLDVVNAVDPIARIRKCPLGIETHAGQLCALHRKLDRAVSLAERALAESSIAELVPRPTCGLAVESGGKGMSQRRNPRKTRP